MEKFNNTTLFTGYLKQLLHNFNLPKYKIYTKAQEDYFNKFGIEREDVFHTITKYSKLTNDVWYPDNLHYIPYIKNGSIQEYINNKWVAAGGKNPTKHYHIQHYDEGIKILNYTKTLKITGNSYDYYTHEYLGDYLRFQRDYNNIDLMPLYNCFSNRPCDRLKYSWEVTDTSGKTIQKVSFDTTDTHYKIYMLPVKLFKNYTIAIDSMLPIEICCGIYTTAQDNRDKFIALPKLTYQKFEHSQFSSPILYSKLGLSPAAIDPANLDVNNSQQVKNIPGDFALKTFGKALLSEVCQNENNLKLFIKVPVTNKSTIIVLEGNYLNWNDTIITLVDLEETDQEANTAAAIKKEVNSAVLNFEKLPIDIPFNLITPLQLLRFNTQEQHPFADRLIEYLIGNVITPTDPINKNVLRVQKVLINQSLNNGGGIDYRGKEVAPYQYYYINKGFWDNYIKYNIYDYINRHNNTFDINHDILGYVDKDAEKYYSYTFKDDEGNIIERSSISAVEVDEEEKL